LATPVRSTLLRGAPRKHETARRRSTPTAGEEMAAGDMPPVSTKVTGSRTFTHAGDGDEEGVRVNEALKEAGVDTVRDELPVPEARLEDSVTTGLENTGNTEREAFCDDETGQALLV
jgi:hypothetical protein